MDQCQIMGFEHPRRIYDFCELWTPQYLNVYSSLFNFFAYDIDSKDRVVSLAIEFFCGRKIIFETQSGYHIFSEEELDLSLLSPGLVHDESLSFDLIQQHQIIYNGFGMNWVNVLKNNYIGEEFVWHVLDLLDVYSARQVCDALALDAEISYLVLPFDEPPQVTHLICKKFGTGHVHNVEFKKGGKVYAIGHNLYSTDEIIVKDSLYEVHKTLKIPKGAKLLQNCV